MYKTCITINDNDCKLESFKINNTPENSCVVLVTPDNYEKYGIPKNITSQEELIDLIKYLTGDICRSVAVINEEEIIYLCRKYMIYNDSTEMKMSKYLSNATLALIHAHPLEFLNDTNTMLASIHAQTLEFLNDSKITKIYIQCRSFRIEIDIEDISKCKYSVFAMRENILENKWVSNC